MTSDTITIISTEFSKLSKLLDQKLKISKRFFTMIINEKMITVNDEYIEEDMTVMDDDLIVIKFNDEDNEYQPEDIPLEIIFENEDILVVNKQSGIVMHPTKNIENGTLANAISKYYYNNNIKRKIRFVNRLDRDTSGIVIVAKNSYAHQYLAEQQEYEKNYLAIVNGKLKNKKGVIKTKIAKENDGIKYNVSDIEGKYSVTEYKLLKEANDKSLVECILHTGRTHQIRVHLSHIGNPILGDMLYGDESNSADCMYLHALSIKFKLPRSHKNKKIETNVPISFKIYK